MLGPVSNEDKGAASGIKCVRAPSLVPACVPVLVLWVVSCVRGGSISRDLRSHVPQM